VHQPTVHYRSLVINSNLFASIIKVATTKSCTFFLIIKNILDKSELCIKIRAIIISYVCLKIYVKYVVYLTKDWPINNSELPGLPLSE